MQRKDEIWTSAELASSKTVTAVVVWLSNLLYILLHIIVIHCSNSVGLSSCYRELRVREDRR